VLLLVLAATRPGCHAPAGTATAPSPAQRGGGGGSGGAGGGALAATLVALLQFGEVLLVGLLQGYLFNKYNRVSRGTSFI